MNAKIPPPLAEAPLLADWVRVSPQGRITFLTGRVELGQGNLTALLHMAADELGVAPETISIQTARTDLSPNEGFTAGSLSVTFGGQALRWAASALRVQIVQAAAERLGVDPETLSVRDGSLVRDGAPTALSIVDLTSDLELSKSVAELANPKSPQDRWHQFRDIPRIDLRERLVGAPFVHDMSAPDMLFGAPIHPPHLNAALMSVDIETLRGRSGVVEVVRDGSFLGVVAKSAYSAVRAVEWARANAAWEHDSREHGDPVKAVAASRAEAQTIIEEGEVNRNDGRWFETTLKRPYLFHASIGTAAAVAVWDRDTATVWTHSQGVFQLRKAIAMTLRISEDDVLVLHRPGAGCYGHNGADDAALDAVLLARAVPGRPVKVVWSRTDEFRSAPMGPAMATTAKALVGPDNRITAMEVIVNSAPHANRPSVNGTPNLLAAAYIADPIAPARSTDLPLSRGGGADRNARPNYAVGDVRVLKRLVHDLPYRSSSLRSLGAFTNVLAIETLMDDIAVEIGETPLDFRMRHLDDPRSRAVLQRLDEETSKVRRASTPEGVGWGLGFARYKGFSGYCAVMVRVSVCDEVRVTDAFCVADIGEIISPDGATNQIEGGIVQSISWTLKEEATFDGAAVAAETWSDYPILTFSEVPRIHVSLIEHSDQPPLGAGEISQGPTAAAVANAVHSALGVRVRRLPITRQAIIAAASE